MGVQVKKRSMVRDASGGRNKIFEICMTEDWKIIQWLEASKEVSGAAGGDRGGISSDGGSGGNMCVKQ